MSEDDEATDDAGASLDVRERLGGDFVTRLASSLAMGAVAALFTFTGMAAFAVLVVAVTMVLSWEWGRLVHGREADLVIAVHMGAAGRGGGARSRRLRRPGAPGPADRGHPGHAAEPRAQQPVLRSRRLLCRPARSRPHLAALGRHAGAARRHLRHHRRHRLGHGRIPQSVGCWVGRSCGRAFRPTRRGPVSSAHCWQAPSSVRSSGLPFRTLPSCAWRRPVLCCQSWLRLAISPSWPSNAASAPRIRARSSRAMAA